MLFSVLPVVHVMCPLAAVLHMHQLHDELLLLTICCKDLHA